MFEIKECSDVVETKRYSTACQPHSSVPSTSYFLSPPCLVDKPQNVRVRYITKPDPLIRSNKRLGLFQELQNGWHDGEGLAPSTSAIKKARDILYTCPSLVPHLSIFPTVEGGVLFEFEIGDWDYSIEIARNGKLEFLGVETNGSREFGPDSFDTVKSLIARLKRQIAK